MKQLWMGGTWVSSRKGYPRQVENPATLVALDEVWESTADDVHQAVQMARDAQPSWRQTPANHRAKHLHAVAAALRADCAALSELLTRESGKPRIETADEVEACAACFDSHAERAHPTPDLAMPPGAQHSIHFTRQEPIGVVGAIVPFNAPLMLLSQKIAPALAAGNSVVAKPSELTPLATLRMAEHCMAALPKGVYSVITGGAEAGEALVDSPHVGAIAFTGSTAVGQRIAQRAAGQLKRVSLELGGIDPLIVFEDADLDVAVCGAAWARFFNAGQACTAAKRIYVVQAVAAAFLERLVRHTASLRLGDGMDPQTDVGPLISAAARARVDDQVQRSLKAGAQLLIGGQRGAVGPGHFYEPTVLSHLEAHHPAVCEEVLGPVAAIQVVPNAHAAIAAAARGEPALGASIYTRNLTYAMQAMEAIEARAFCINDPLTGLHNSATGHAPVHQTQHVHLNYLLEKKPHWFPYGARRGELP